MSRCADSNCGYYWKDENEDYPRCHYPDNDPFPAPCEYDDYLEIDDSYEEDKNKEWDCSHCFHQYSELADSVSCCACCECGSFFDPIRDNED